MEATKALSFLLSLSAAAALLPAAGQPPPAGPRGIHYLGEAHAYKKIGERKLNLHVLKPADWKPGDRRPSVVFFFGGGWMSGFATQFDEQSRYLATRGMVCIQVEYRRLDRAKNDPPAICAQDAKSSLRWVRAHAAELGIDPQRIAAGGGSAGGHLAAFAGMVGGQDDPQDDLAVSPRPDALLLWNPVFDNGPDGGYGTQRIGDRYPEFSPAHNITPDDPPALVLVGTRDNLVPVRVVERFRANMQKAGVRCDVIFYQDQGHGFYTFKAAKGALYAYETLLAADRFLVSLGWLEGPPTLQKPSEPPGLSKGIK
jgi:acetyl esterase/lipase